MIRALVTSTLALGLLVFGCSTTQPADDTNPARSTGGSSGGSRSGGSTGSGGAQTGGSSGGSNAGGSSNSGGSVGTGGDSAGGGGGGGSPTGGSAGGSMGTGGDSAGGGSGGSSADGPAAADVPVSTGDGGATGPGPGVVPLEGKAGDYICPHTATKEQCCQMLCECVNRICTDSPKAKPGIAGCMPTCMKGSDMVARCHVYHCYESVSPSGVKDHDSHCGHAANQVNGGGCPAGVL